MGKEKKAPVKAKEEIKEEGGVVKAIMGFNLTFWLFGFSGMAALIYEVVWTRALSLVLGSTTYALSTMLASFMAGLSLGAVLGGFWADRSKNPARLFAALETGIAVSALMVIPLINILPPVYARLYYSFHQSFSSFSVIQFILCFLIMLIPTTLMGATFPVVCRINYRNERSVGMETGGVYAINTVGAIAGAFLAGFVFIPSIGVRYTNTLAAFINIAVSLTLFFAYVPENKLRKISKVLLVFAVTAIVSNGILLNSVYPFGYYTAWRFPSYEVYQKMIGMESGLYEKLYEKDNAQGNVKVLQLEDGQRNIFINGRTESSTKTDILNTALLAYLPVAARPDAASFLSIGLGNGNTLHFASTVSGLKEMFSLEINPAVEEAVRRYFYPELFKDRRIRFITADARNYLMLVDRKYDIISSEPSYPVDQGFSHLFSKEFFDLVRSRLNEGGAFCQWVPTYLFSEEQMVMILKSFAAVFPNTTVWGVQDTEILFVGMADDKPQPVDDMKQRVDGWLKGQGIEPGYSLYVNTGEIDGAIGGYEGPINTDDFPILEFYAARNMLVR